MKKFIIEELLANINGTLQPYGSFQDISLHTFLSNFFFTFDYTSYSDKPSIIAAINAVIVAQAVTLGYTGFTASDVIWLASGLDAVTLPRSFNNAPGASIVTGTGATGTQISATRDAQVSYSPTLVTTASISGNASDVLVLEIAATNSATAGDWKEIARLTNAQALTLAITLQSVQTTSGSLAGIVPAGWYRKIRAITSGTVSNSMSSGQEVLL